MKPNGNIELSIGGESMSFTAQELEKQIEYLAHMRRQMPEPVPVDPPKVEHVVVNPAYTIRTDKVTKSSLLRLRHSGLGWLNFELPAEEVLQMRRAWIDIVYKLGLDPSSFGEYTGPERRRSNLH